MYLCSLTDIVSSLVVMFGYSLRTNDRYCDLGKDRFVLFPVIDRNTKVICNSS